MTCLSIDDIACMHFVLMGNAFLTNTYIFYPNLGEELKYLKAARELVKPERNTLTVSMKDVERYNPGLAQSIQDEYYRLYPFLCAALKNYVQDRADMSMEKEYFVAFSDVDAQLKVRDLTR